MPRRFAAPGFYESWGSPMYLEFTNLPPITPVIDFGKPGGTQPSCNPPRFLYSRILGSTGSSINCINGTQQRSLQHVYIRVDLCVPCKLPPLLPIPRDGCLRSSWRGGSLQIYLDFLLTHRHPNGCAMAAEIVSRSYPPSPTLLSDRFKIPFFV